MGFEWTTIAGSMPILFASCSAAPSALGPKGIGSVNDVWIMPSPVVSPYGRTYLFASDILGLQHLRSRVEVLGGLLDHAVRALALVRGALHQPERAVRDGVEQAVVDDALQQIDGLAEHLVRALDDE